MQAAQAACRCAANAARLRKIKSMLPFRLHVQEYVELVRSNNTTAALAYARAHLAAFAPDYLPEFKAAMALLVFGPRTRCARYAALLAEARWQEVADIFLADLLRSHNLSPVPLLELLLQARPSG